MPSLAELLAPARPLLLRTRNHRSWVDFYLSRGRHNHDGFLTTLATHISRPWNIGYFPDELTTPGATDDDCIRHKDPPWLVSPLSKPPKLLGDRWCLIPKPSVFRGH